MAKIDLKVLLDDVRARDLALFSAIAASDRQSVALFRIYVTMVLALISVVAAVSASADFEAKSWLIAAGAIAAVGLAFGCWLCFRAIKTAEVALPGKGAEFWQWASHQGVTEDHLIEVYLDQSLSNQDLNFTVNKRSATSMRAAKAVGMTGIGIGALVALIGATGLPAYSEGLLRSHGLFADQAAEEAEEAVEAVDSVLPDQSL